MAIWEKINSLELPEQDKVLLHDLYMRGNLMEVRPLFASWIEETPWTELERGNPEDTTKAQELFNILLTKIRERAQPQGNDLINQMKFIKLGQVLQEMYGNDVWGFVDTVKHVLETEQNVIESLTKPIEEDVKSPKSPSADDIYKFIEQLQAHIQVVDARLKEYQQNQEKFVIEYQQFTLIELELAQLQNNSSLTAEEKERRSKLKQKDKSDIENVLKRSADKLLREREDVFRDLQKLCEWSDLASGKANEELVTWQIMQQKSLSGGDKPEELSMLQVWFESLAELLWSLYQMIASYKMLFDSLPIVRQGDEKDLIEKLMEQAVRCLTMIIRRSFIVEKQPPQVLKTQTKFQSSVRLLVGGKLNLQFNCPTVKATIVSEKQAKEIVRGLSIEQSGNCGDLLNCECVMQMDSKSGVFSAEFKNLSLKKIKRQDRRGQEVVSVLEAKSAIVFTANISINGKDLPVTCISFPVVVVVHGNQGPSSEATIFWDNMFSKPDRNPFDVPDSVPWDDMEIALNARWKMTTERELQPAHMLYIKMKLVGDLNAAEVTWAQFNRETVKDRNFTFWEWFYAAMEVVKKHLKEHWKSGYIEFVSRDQAREKLMTKVPGTFLIRFSDGELGGVSIAWTVMAADGGKEVWNLQPFTAKDFSIRTLADSIFDLIDIQYIYPDIPKENAFGEFRSDDAPFTRPNQNEYVPAHLKRDMGIPRNDSRMESPVSPLSYGPILSHPLNEVNVITSELGSMDVSNIDVPPGLMGSSHDPSFVSMDDDDSLEGFCPQDITSFFGGAAISGADQEIKPEDIARYFQEPDKKVSKQSPR